MTRWPWCWPCGTVWAVLRPSFVLRQPNQLSNNRSISKGCGRRQHLFLEQRRRRFCGRFEAFGASNGAPGSHGCHAVSVGPRLTPQHGWRGLGGGPHGASRRRNGNCEQFRRHRRRRSRLVALWAQSASLRPAGWRIPAAGPPAFLDRPSGVEAAARRLPVALVGGGQHAGICPSPACRSWWSMTTQCALKWCQPCCSDAITKVSLLPNKRSRTCHRLPLGRFQATLATSHRAAAARGSCSAYGGITVYFSCVPWCSGHAQQRAGRPDAVAGAARNEPAV